jgi:hypothetical protein
MTPVFVVGAPGVVVGVPVGIPVGVTVGFPVGVVGVKVGVKFDGPPPTPVGRGAVGTPLPAGPVGPTGPVGPIVPMLGGIGVSLGRPMPGGPATLGTICARAKFGPIAVASVAAVRIASAKAARSRTLHLTRWLAIVTSACSRSSTAARYCAGATKLTIFSCSTFFNRLAISSFVIRFSN